MMETTTARTRPTYAAAPLRFVAFEVQFGLAPALATAEGRATVYSQLRGTYPLADAQLVMPVTPMLSGAPGSDLVMIDPGRTRSVTIGPTALTLQTTAFSNSDEFVRAIQQALGAIEPVGVPEVRRVGLRFVDEIRIPGVESAADWEPYISPDLLAVSRFARDYPVESEEHHVVLQIAEDLRGVIRYGPRQGFAVDPRGRLKLADMGQGSFFLLDIDAAWQPAPDVLLPLRSKEIIDIYWRLDEPSHLLFERAIRDRAREAFTGEEA